MSESQANPSNIDLSIAKPYTPTEAQVQRYTSRKIASAWTMFGGSLAVLAIVIVLIILFVSIFHVIVYSARIIVALLIVLIFPIYAIYNLFATISRVKKRQFSFYSSEIFAKNDKGYIVKGISASGLSFIDKADAGAEKTPGAPVIVVNMKDEFDLLGWD